MMNRIISVIILLLAMAPCAYAEDKNWTAKGDGSGWFDDTNWMPAASPTASDDVMINLTGAAVSVPQAFDAKSVTLGGKRASKLTISNFASGVVEPENTTDLALHNRRDGHLVLTGSAGKVTLKGGYKDSETVIPDEPSLMFYAE